MESPIDGNLIANESSPKALNFKFLQCVLLDAPPLDPHGLQHICHTPCHTNLKCTHNQMWIRNGVKTSYESFKKTHCGGRDSP